MEPRPIEGERRPCVSSFDPDEGRRPRSGKAKPEPEGRRDAAKPKKPAFQRIVALCAVRDRSQQEVRDRLQRDGYAAEEAEAALARAVDCGLVDDRRFADAFVRARISAGKGEVVIKRDLQRHGLALVDVPGWPEDYGYDEQGQLDAAVRFLRAHPPTAKDARGAGYRKLMGKGYPASVSSKAVRIWLEGESAQGRACRG